MAHALSVIDDAFLTSAPAIVTVSVELPNSPEQVWDALGSEQMWSWVGAVDRLSWLTPEPRAEGCVRQLRLGRFLTLQEEFYRWDAPRRATFRVTQASSKLVKALAEDFVLEPLDGGGTRLTWTMASDLAGPKLPTAIIKRQNQKMIDGITKILPAA